MNQKAQIRKSIRKWDDPVLSQVCEPVEKFDTELEKLVKDMIEVLQTTKDGVGLAAPQIGVTKQVIVYRTSLESKDYMVMVNPLQVDQSFDLIKSHEGCLSYPGFQAVVDRFVKVKVNYKTVTGADKEVMLEGRASVIYQHESDHLSGICPVRDVWKEKTGRNKQNFKTIDESDFFIEGQAGEIVSVGASTEPILVDVTPVGENAFEPNLGGDAFDKE